MPDYAGLIKFPTGGDIYGGGNEPQWWKDLAITVLAEIRAQTAYRTHISGSFNADNVEDGTDLVHSIVSQTGTPGDGTWWITTATIASTSRMQEAIEYGSTPKVMRRFRGSAGWSGWTRTDAGAIDLSTLGGGGSGASPAAFKTAPLALTVGGSGTAGPTSGSYRMPIRFGATITRWRLHLRNINPRFGEDGPNVSVGAVYFGPATVGGQYTATPAVIASTLRTEEGDAVTPWQSTPIQADTQYAIAYYLSGTATNAVVGGGWSASSPNSTAATLTRVTNLPLDAWIEAEIEPAVPVIAAFGDSISSGVGATLPVYDSWLSQWCRENGALPVHYTASGDTMAGWDDTNHYKWQRWQNLSRPDAVIHAMGSNDVFGGASLETMKERRAKSLNHLRNLVSSVIYSGTILPRDGTTGAMEDTRRAYNAWLKGKPDASHDTFDFVPAVSADDENLAPGVSADSIHLNTVGYRDVSRTIDRPLASTEVRDDIDGLRTDLDSVFVPKVLSGSGANLNNLTTPGTYRVNYSSAGSLANNFPVDAGPNPIIDVAPWGTSSNVIQTVKYPRDHGVWMRGYYGAVWQSWQNVGPVDAGARLAALERDTGSRLLEMRPGASGQVRVQRQADRVTLTLRDVMPEPGTFGIVVCDLPSGFRAPQDTPLLASDFTWKEAASVYIARANHNLYWVRTITDSSTRPTSPQSGTVTYRTTDSWPTTLPGSPA